MRRASFAQLLAVILFAVFNHTLNCSCCFDRLNLFVPTLVDLISSSVYIESR